MASTKKYISSKFISDKFDIDRISNLSLFLYDQLLVIIAHPEKVRAISGVHIYTINSKEDLNVILDADELINQSRATGKLTVHHQKFGLVPGPLFNPSHTSLYLNFSTDLEKGDWEISYEGVHNNSIQVVSALDKSFLTKLDGLIPELEIAHGAAQVLDFFLNNNQDLLNQEIFINISPGSIYIAAFKGGELVLFNRFAIHEEADFLKYVLTVIQQLAFDRVHCKISLFGNLDYVHCELENLQRYFKNIQLKEQKQNIEYQPGAEDFKNTRLLEAFWSPNNL
ncbi:MAG: DUF3822 family protein [Cyclobacteriaceae bacterium]